MEVEVDIQKKTPMWQILYTKLQTKTHYVILKAITKYKSIQMLISGFPKWSML